MTIDILLPPKHDVEEGAPLLRGTEATIQKVRDDMNAKGLLILTFPCSEAPADLVSEFCGLDKQLEELEAIRDSQPPQQPGGVKYLAQPEKLTESQKRLLADQPEQGFYQRTEHWRFSRIFVTFYLPIYFTKFFLCLRSYHGCC